MDMNNASGQITWRTLVADNMFGIAALFCILLLSFGISAVGFLGIVLFMSGIPFVLAMLPVSFLTLLASKDSAWRMWGWFAAALFAWAISPVLGGWIYPIMNSWGDPATISDPGTFVVWTQWLWALPFLAIYALIGAVRNHKQRQSQPASNPAIV